MFTTGQKLMTAKKCELYRNSEEKDNKRIDTPPVAVSVLTLNLCFYNKIEKTYFL